MDNYIDFGDENLKKWIVFFNAKKISNTKYIALLKNTDKYFLTSSPPKDVEDDINQYLPDNGLLENDLLKVMYQKVGNEDAKTRLIISIYNNVNLNTWFSKYPYLKDIVEKSLIEGKYEQYGIEFEKVVKLALDKKLIDKDDFIDTALLRGVLLSSRYPNNKELKKLEILKFFNKCKVILSI